jgi:stearoyl-CoA desaturase (delta-9 desaturase)
LVSAYAGFGIFAHKVAHHRFSHRKYEDTLVNQLLTFGVIIFTALTSPLNFSVLHRHHHTFSDTPNDPHSPAQIKWWEVYLLMWKHVTINPVLGRDFMRSKFQRWIHENFVWVHFLTCILLALIDIRLVVFIISPCVIYTFHVNGLINWLGHRDGVARNAPELAWLTPFTWRHGDHHDL